MLKPLYRFPVNDQSRYEVKCPMTPTVDNARKKMQKILSLPDNWFNHAVILKYRSGEDSIGWHQDKTLDLDADSPIVCMSFGYERPFAFRDDHFNPKQEIQVVGRSGSAVVITGKTNLKW
mmetsp:Transcript_28370/g.62539  ORF Transcript_28370/g.62539 Transcript_28370/m.62539 type:complete len:120 (+) Transcript_28370:161-520(+)